MSRGPSAASRAALALALFFGFYVFALAIVAGLLSIPVLEYVAIHHVHLQLGIFCLVGAVVILVSLVPRRDRFVPPGPRLDADREPRLFAAIASIAAKTGQKMPRHVYLVGDVNAWVAQRGGVMGLGSHRVMGVGLPLLQLLTVAQLRAVLAHEFGHFHGGDTRLGPWIYKTRAAIGRTLSGLAFARSPLLMMPFSWYGKLFLRITHGVSRQQELAADALACEVVGTTALVGGLRTIHAAAPAFAAYWQREVSPLLNAGFAPPIAAGFRHFVGVEQVAGAMRNHLDRELREAKADPYDTHPPLAERIAAVEGVRHGSRSITATDEPAISLLEDVAVLERELLAAIAGPAASKLRSIDWERTGEAFLVPVWTQTVALNHGAFERHSVGELGAIAATRVDEFAKQLSLPPQGERGAAVRKQAALWNLGAALSLALHRSGWSVVSLPGDPIKLCRGDVAIATFNLIGELEAGKLPLSAWDELCARNDIAGAPIVAS